MVEVGVVVVRVRGSVHGEGKEGEGVVVRVRREGEWW